MAVNILSNINLKHLNTFGVDCYASHYVEINTKEDLLEILPKINNKKYMILAGGSNVLFISDFDGLIIYNKIKGKGSISQSEFWANSGEIWHEFVLWTIDNQAFGLENLSLIPGSVGAAPIQNIGAYGVEVKNYISRVVAIDLSNGEEVEFTNSECEFGYRESVFKRKIKGKYFIYKVFFDLKPLNEWSPNINYGNIREKINSKNISNPNPGDISKAIINIRQSKLPNPKEIGNAGSFFKNPVINILHFDKLKIKFPKIPNYPIDDTTTKIPAGWLIDNLGLKGYREGNIGIHSLQALVLVNYGGGTGKQIYDLSQMVIDKVKYSYDIDLEREVNIIR